MLTRNESRFWIPYFAACGTWVLAGIWVLGGAHRGRTMSLASQLELRGGQCPAQQGSCQAGCDTSLYPPCNQSTVASCSCVGCACDTDTSYADGSGSQQCVAGGGQSGCAYDDTVVKCADLINCVCKMNNNNKYYCDNGATTPVDIGNCLSGTPAPP